MIKQKLARLMSVCNETGNAPNTNDKLVQEAGGLMNEIEDIATKEPSQIWDILRNGSNAEFCALLPMVQSLGSKLKGPDNNNAASELQKIAGQRGMSNLLSTAMGAIGGTGNASGGLGALGGLVGAGIGGKNSSSNDTSPLNKLQSIKQLMGKN
ncbi:MAG: hypothetical protein FWC92_11130 [Defluviitaleaceae bacterium]|nr:hypothetical protein [Defluviitaleaceae bacterium]